MNQEWWKKSVVYQIYPKSFNDTNGDGILTRIKKNTVTEEILSHPVKKDSVVKSDRIASSV